jgi:hypothetical protein
MTMTQQSRRRTRLWLATYTAVLIAITVASIAASKWSLALTTLAISVVFAWITARFWRKR